MKLSVLLVSYNQVSYIDQCLDGIIDQQFDQEFEIVVADDFSTDGTIEKIKEKLGKVEIQYRILESNETLGLGGNYYRGVENCQGEYVAILEGDDYWVDPMRLQKLVRLMDENPSCPMCFNPFSLYYDAEGRLETFKASKVGEVKYFNSETLILYNLIGNLSACVFRRSVLMNYVDFWLIHNITDWFLGIAMGQHGLVAMLNEPMSVYRVRPDGLWSKHSDEERKLLKNKLTLVYDHLLDYQFTRGFYAFRLAANIKFQRDSLSQKLPESAGRILRSTLTQGMIFRFGKLVSKIIPESLIEKNEEILEVFQEG